MGRAGGLLTAVCVSVCVVGVGVEGCLCGEKENEKKGRKDTKRLMGEKIGEQEVEEDGGRDSEK